MEKKAFYISLMVFFLAMSFLLPDLILNKEAAFAAAPDYWQGSPQEYDQLVKDAKKEGKLIWYTSLDEENAAGIAQEFNKLYPGIKVESVRAHGLESGETILMEIRSGVTPIDVLEVSDELVQTYKDLKLFKKCDWEKFKIDPVQLGKDGTMLKIGGNIHGFVYNTKKVSAQDAPKTFEDLLDPKWKGRKLGTDTRPKFFTNLWPAWGEKKMADYLKKLSKQELLYKSGGTAGITMTGAGECSIWLGGTYDAFMKVKKQGAPIEYILAIPIAISTEKEGVVSSGPHPNAAFLFLGWLASGGQEIYDRLSNGEGMPLPGANTQQGRLIKNFRKDQLSIFDDEWVPRKGEINKKCNEFLGLTVK